MHNRRACGAAWAKAKQRGACTEHSRRCFVQTRDRGYVGRVEDALASVSSRTTLQFVSETDRVVSADFER